MSPAIVLAAVTLSACGSGGELEVHQLEPNSGSAQGEQPVKILGANFRTDIGYTVYFGNRKAEHVTILNPETMVVSTPRHDEPGTVDLRIFADTGAGWKVHQAFEFEDTGGEPGELQQDQGGKLKY